MFESSKGRKIRTEGICQITTLKVVATKYARSVKEKTIFVPSKNLLFVRKLEVMRLFLTIKRYVKAGFSFQIKFPGIWLHLDNLLAISEGYYSLEIIYRHLHRYG